MLKSFLSYVGMWGNNRDAGIPPPPGRVKDRGGIRVGGSSELAIERGGCSCKVPAYLEAMFDV